MSTAEWLPWFAFAMISAGVFLFGWIAARLGSAAPNTEGVVAIVDEPRMFGLVTAALAGMVPDLFAYKVDRDLRRAGFHRPSAKTEYLALRNVLFIGTILTTAVWFLAVDEQGSSSEALWIVGLIGGVAAILTYSLPRLWLSWTGDRRADRIVQGFPDALDVMVMGLVGGLPLQTALERISGQIRFAHQDLATELDIVRRQALAGSLEQALRRLAERLDIDEITALTALVTHAEQTGTNVSSVLREYAGSLRQQRMQRAEEVGNKMSINMLFPVVLCLAPATFIVMLTPPLLDLRNFRDRENEAGGVLAQPDLSKINRRGSSRRSPPGNPPAANANATSNGATPRSNAGSQATGK